MSWMSLNYFGPRILFIKQKHPQKQTGNFQGDFNPVPCYRRLLCPAFHLHSSWRHSVPWRYAAGALAGPHKYGCFSNYLLMCFIALFGTTGHLKILLLTAYATAVIQFCKRCFSSHNNTVLKCLMICPKPFLSLLSTHTQSHTCQKQHVEKPEISPHLTCSSCASFLKVRGHTRDFSV